MGPHMHSLPPQEVLYLTLAKRLEMEISRILQVRTNLREGERERERERETDGQTESDRRERQRQRYISSQTLLAGEQTRKRTRNTENCPLLDSRSKRQPCHQAASTQCENQLGCRLGMMQPPLQGRLTA